MTFKNASREVIIRINYRDFEGEIKDRYGMDYSVVESLKCDNHSTHEYIIKKEEKLTVNESKELDKFAIGEIELICSPDLLLQDLCNKSFIEDGRYIIEVSWEEKSDIN